MLLLYDPSEYENTCDGTIATDNCVEKEEHKEVSVVVKSHTFVKPNAMMIKFLHTDIAKSAVLRPGWLWNLTSTALCSLDKHNSVILESHKTLLYVGLLYYSWVSPASHQETEIAYHH